ncbi:MAG: 4-hydroxy-tetrahydrodipicolinate reductase [Rhizomicrobium sp.]
MSAATGALRIVVAGAAGRMGRELVRTILADSACVLVGALEAPSHAELGSDAASLAGCPPGGVALSEDAAQALAAADALVDFTAPAVSVSLAALAADARIVHVLGTTGFSEAQEAGITAAAKRTAIVKSGNMSLGVTLLAALARRAARALPDYDVSVLDMHHRTKKDAPSGTAILLGRAIADARSDAQVAYASLRGGTVVGEHQVILAGPHERLVLAHVAEDRSIFARGAVAAAKWGQARAPGLYSMADVLGLAE